MKKFSSFPGIISMFSVIIFCVGCAGEAPPYRKDQGTRTDGKTALDGADRADSAVAKKDGPLQNGDRGQPVADSGADSYSAHPDKTIIVPDHGVPDLWTSDGSIGKPCQGWGDCPDPYICTTNTHTGHTYCTLFCDPCAANPCPAGTGCQPAGSGYFICALGYPNSSC